MGRQKQVRLQLSGGKAIFLTSGTEVVKELPFSQATLSIQGDGFKVDISLFKTPTVGEFTADIVAEYTEDIKQWR